MEKPIPVHIQPFGHRIGDLHLVARERAALFPLDPSGGVQAAFLGGFLDRQAAHLCPGKHESVGERVGRDRTDDPALALVVLHVAMVCHRPRIVNPKEENLSDTLVVPLADNQCS